jgi:hypothetical protein
MGTKLVKIGEAAKILGTKPDTFFLLAYMVVEVIKTRS